MEHLALILVGHQHAFERGRKHIEEKAQPESSHVLQDVPLVQKPFEWLTACSICFLFACFMLSSIAYSACCVLSAALLFLVSDAASRMLMRGFG